MSLGGDEVIDGLSSLKALVSLDQDVDTINQDLDKFALRFSETSQVGDVISGILGQRGLATSSALAETELSKEVIKTLVLLQVSETQMHGGTDNCSQVGWAGADVSETLITHEFVSLLLHETLDLGEATAEAAEDGAHVSSLLHGDDTDVILLVDPDQEVLAIVVPDTTSIGPVTGTSRGGKESSSWLLKQEVILDQSFHVLVVHGGQGEVLASEVLLKTSEGIGDDLLHQAALSTAHGGWEADSTDGASAPDAARLDVLLIEDTANQLLVIEIGSGMDISGLEVMDLFNAPIEEVLEGLVAVLITEDASGLLSVELVAGVVHTSLDALVKGDTVGGDFVPVLLVQFFGQLTGHHIVVFGQVREVVRGREFAGLPWLRVTNTVF